MKNLYDIEFYITHEEQVPFQRWIDGIHDKLVCAKIMARFARIRLGNFGDHVVIEGTNGQLYELREHTRPGYRVYYTVIEEKVIILGGSNKKDQKKVIKKIKEYLSDFLE